MYFELILFLLLNRLIVHLTITRFENVENVFAVGSVHYPAQWEEGEGFRNSLLFDAGGGGGVEDGTGRGGVVDGG